MRNLLIIYKISTQKYNNIKIQTMSLQQLSNIRSKIQQNLTTKLSPTNNYQKYLLIIFTIGYFFAAMPKFISYFVFMNPVFICQGIQTPEIEACQKFQECHILNDQTGTFYSGLYCDRQYLRVMTQSAIFIGIFVANFILTPLNDLKGRRFTFILSYIGLLIGVNLLYAGIYLKLWYLLVIAQFINGISCSGINVLFIVIIRQFCDKLTGQRSILICYAMWGLAVMSYGFSYYYLPNWSPHIIYLIILPSILMIIALYIFLLETPHYCLFIAKNQKQFQETIQKLIEYNGVNEQSLVQLQGLSKQFLELSKIHQQTKANAFTSLKLLTGNTTTLKNCICMTIISVLGYLYYTGMQGTMERTGYSFGISMLISGTYEVISNCASIFLIDKITKRKGLFLCSLGLVLCGLSFMLPFVKQYDSVQSVILSIATFCNIFVFVYISLIQMEIFSTDTLTIAVGVSKTACGVVFVQPFIINWMNNRAIHPAVFCGSMFLVFGIAPIFLYDNKQQTQAKLNKVDCQEQQWSINEDLDAISRSNNLKQTYEAKQKQ